MNEARISEQNGEVHAMGKPPFRGFEISPGRFETPLETLQSWEGCRETWNRMGRNDQEHLEHQKLLDRWIELGRSDPGRWLSDCELVPREPNDLKIG